ncbi:MAG TPA: DUF4392 domain-containing protein [Candidatus Blautia avistercoris]|nr:DUF4392 domain-containing protein [Candidatus Blautia avistercoris]
METGTRPMEETVEDVVLRHSNRGMNILREYMEEDYCKKAVERLLSLEKGNVLLTTGFYVAGHAETDGPVGTMAVAKALDKLGFQPTIVTDQYCRGFFEIENLNVEYMELHAGSRDYEELLEKYQPVCLISIERCGHNVENDYANMRGISIKKETARVDRLFELAMDREIPTFGIGDGGNEIGMGNLKEIIAGKLSLVPCEVEVDDLIIATVSNWGAYAMTAYMQMMEHVPVLPSYEEVKAYLKEIVKMGSVDGVTKEQVLSVDGFSLEVEKEILNDLHKVVATS